jgi:hypothetical protein
MAYILDKFTHTSYCESTSAKYLSSIYEICNVVNEKHRQKIPVELFLPSAVSRPERDTNLLQKTNGVLSAAP